MVSDRRSRAVVLVALGSAFSASLAAGSVATLARFRAPPRRCMIAGATRGMHGRPARHCFSYVGTALIEDI